jgi:mersacidin/lichenicidin family type 2 lantibiotic
MNDIVRMWKDEAYRQGLSTEEQALLPANPVGIIELTEVELETISGALDHCHEERVSQEVDQRAVATYGNDIISGEAVWGVAHNSYRAYNNEKSVSSEESCRIL